MAAAVVAAIFGAGAAVLYVYDPAMASFYPKCMFNSLTGLYCPGCGAARALHQLAHGNLRVALGFNPLVVASLPFIAYSGIASMLRKNDGGRRPATMSHYMPWVILAVVVLFWVLRNVPVFPFNLLAPRG